MPALLLSVWQHHACAWGSTRHTPSPAPTHVLWPPQISAKCADSVARVPSLRLLRLEKSYWLRLEDRWTKASLRAITRLKQQRPDMQVDFKHETPGGFRLAW